MERIRCKLIRMKDAAKSASRTDRRTEPECTVFPIH